MPFTGKVILITGGGSGIGAETARHLAKLGADLSIVDMNEQALWQVADEIHKAGTVNLLTIAADVTKDAARIIEETIIKFGNLNVLVNNAATIHSDLLADINLTTFDHVMNTNVRSVIALTQLAIPHLEKTKGNIINVSSAAAIKPFYKSSVYSISKTVMNMMTQCLALELKTKGIRVNALLPFFVVTPKTFSTIPEAERSEKIQQIVDKYCLLGRPGTVSDNAAAIEFLASDDSSYINGALMRIDGGICLI